MLNAMFLLDLTSSRARLYRYAAEKGIFVVQDEAWAASVLRSTVNSNQKTSGWFSKKKPSVLVEHDEQSIFTSRQPLVKVHWDYFTLSHQDDLKIDWSEANIHSALDLIWQQFNLILNPLIQLANNTQLAATEVVREPQMKPATLILSVPNQVSRKSIEKILGVLSALNLDTTAVIDREAILQELLQPQLDTKPHLASLHLNFTDSCITQRSEKNTTDILALINHGRVQLVERLQSIMAQRFIQETRFDPLQKVEWSVQIFQQIWQRCFSADKDNPVFEFHPHKIENHPSGKKAIKPTNSSNHDLNNPQIHQQTISITVTASEFANDLNNLFGAFFSEADLQQQWQSFIANNTKQNNTSITSAIEYEHLSSIFKQSFASWLSQQTGHSITMINADFSQSDVHQHTLLAKKILQITYEVSGEDTQWLHQLPSENLTQFKTKASNQPTQHTASLDAIACNAICTKDGIIYTQEHLYWSPQQGLTTQQPKEYIAQFIWRSGQYHLAPNSNNSDQAACITLNMRVVSDAETPLKASDRIKSKNENWVFCLCSSGVQHDQTNEQINELGQHPA